jgi:hypothetical protein
VSRWQCEKIRHSAPAFASAVPERGSTGSQRPFSVSPENIGMPQMTGGRPFQVSDHRDQPVASTNGISPSPQPSVLRPH